MVDIGSSKVLQINKKEFMAKRSNKEISGLSFSWKRALGISQAKQKIARETGIPTSKVGIERKIGASIPIAYSFGWVWWERTCTKVVFLS